MTLSSPFLLYVCIGITAGILSGFFGIGGGLVIVPALMLCAGFSQLSANGTSLAVLMVPVGLVAVLNYYRHGNVNIKAALIIAVSFVIAAAVSSCFVHKINPAGLRIAFGIVMISVGSYVIITGIHRP
ncbi:MAG: sulfite exporter TauE/SafE family protein [Chitinispirillaceae bacterium]|nr:sulfite exporter TauE/SafE family protein [Chitinispirillaceae bacterium]